MECRKYLALIEKAAMAERNSAFVIKNVFDEIASFEGLGMADHDSSLGRRFLPEELSFWDNREDNLHRISECLYSGSYPPDIYRTFPVYEPKLRKITCSDYTTKVIQRSAYNALNRRLINGFIADSYACIPGRGNLAAGQRLASWIDYCARSGKRWYYLKADCEKFFYRIDQNVLMTIYDHKIADRRTLDFLDHYTRHASKAFGLPRGISNPMTIDQDKLLWDKGVAIGGGMSHMSGNVYLNELDQYAKRDLQIRFFIRCMDDIVILMDDKAKLHEVYHKLKDFLETRLLLNFNHKTAIRPIECGVEFVGYQIKPHSMRLRKSTSLHMKRRLKQVQELYSRWEMSFFEANETVQAYIAMMDKTDSEALRKKIFSEFVLRRKDGEHDGPFIGG